MRFTRSSLLISFFSSKDDGLVMAYEAALLNYLHAGDSLWRGFSIKFRCLALFRCNELDREFDRKDSYLLLLNWFYVKRLLILCVLLRLP